MEEELFTLSNFIEYGILLVGLVANYFILKHATKTNAIEIKELKSKQVINEAKLEVQNNETNKIVHNYKDRFARIELLIETKFAELEKMILLQQQKKDN